MHGQVYLKIIKKGEYRRIYTELEKFYNKIIENLEEESNLKNKKYKLKYFQDENYIIYAKENIFNGE